MSKPVRIVVGGPEHYARVQTLGRAVRELLVATATPKQPGDSSLMVYALIDIAAELLAVAPENERGQLIEHYQDFLAQQTARYGRTTR